MGIGRRLLKLDLGLSGEWIKPTWAKWSYKIASPSGSNGHNDVSLKFQNYFSGSLSTETSNLAACIFCENTQTETDLGLVINK